MFLLPYPPRHSGIGSLFELRVSRKAVPDDVGCVVLVPELWTAFKQEVYDEELDTGVQACREENQQSEKAILEKKRGP